MTCDKCGKEKLAGVCPNCETSDLGIGFENNTRSVKEVYQQTRETFASENSYDDANGVATALRVAGIIVMIAGFIGGFGLGNALAGKYDDFSIGWAFVGWVSAFIGGIGFFGLAEIVKLLQGIRSNMGTNSSDIPKL